MTTALVHGAALPLAGAPADRLAYTRKGMVLHAVQQAINTSRNALAVEALRDLIAECPTLAKAHSFLGAAVGRMGDAEAALEHHERAVELDPADLTIHSTRIFALDQSGDVTLKRAYRARRAFAERISVDPATIAPHENDRDPDRRLRIGYVSADFRNHSAAYGWGPVVLAHSRTDTEVYAYSNNDEEDARTADFRANVEHWRDAWRMSDDALEAQIREDRVDVLVDLSGHSMGHRLEVFARHPAPVQITAWGYQTGIGLEGMYLFADDVTIRPDEERWYAEEVIRLPRALTCWAPDVRAVGYPGAPPADVNGYLTFGCFNRLGKIQPCVLAAWAEILARLPDARILLKCPGLDDEAARAETLRRFEAEGGDARRLDLLGLTPQDEHLRAFHRVDVQLDPSPHGGGMTTLDAAWMGVPTLTLPHLQIPSRIATTINRELGLDYLIAADWPDYVARAVALNDQRDELRRVRRLMREMMTVSAFGNHVAYTRAVEATYRALWQRWCRGEGPKRLRAVS